MKIYKKVILSALILIMAVLLFYLKTQLKVGNEYKFIIEAVIGSGSFTLVLVFLNWLLENIDNLWFSFLNICPFKRQEIIRVSIAYIFRIRIDGKYLLIKNKNINCQYQPVGGVFKYFQEAKPYFEELEILEDCTNSLPKSFNQKNDLRIRIKRKKLNKFLKWYNERAQREVSVQREFYEELINETKYLDKDDFPYIDYKYLYTNRLKIRFSRPFQIKELLLHEVYELIPLEICDKDGNIRNQEQILRKNLEDWQEKEEFEKEIIWADEDLILRQGAPKRIKIAEHTPNLINKN